MCKDCVLIVYQYALEQKHAITQNTSASKSTKQFTSKSTSSFMSKEASLLEANIYKKKTANIKNNKI